ncbi:unnamed protein product [marine sediment metagenome]|uniref:Uncharacterized protein n=1 Tax=marine sediment metagenome TaxID=412755 RepID=X1GQE0_9ZZZZ
MKIEYKAVELKTCLTCVQFTRFVYPGACLCFKTEKLPKGEKPTMDGDILSILVDRSCFEENLPTTNRFMRKGG